MSLSVLKELILDNLYTNEENPSNKKFTPICSVSISLDVNLFML